MLKIYKATTKKVIFRTLTVLLVPVIAVSSLITLLTINKPSDFSALAASCGGIYEPLPSIITSRIDRNKAIYQQVAQERGVPWEVLAAIHYRETNNSRVNPNNNQGIYQLYSIYQSNPAYASLARSSSGQEVSAVNFLEQTRFAADFIQSKARSSGTTIVTPRNLTTNETNISLIKNTLFSYNGRAAAYVKQAERYNFDPAAQPYEGSPYVMNRFDCQRSGMPIITCDGCSNPSSTDTRLGAFTLYARLKGDSYWLSLVKQPLPSCTTSNVRCVWEFENEDTKKRFYTSSISERDTVYRLNYRPIGIAFHTRTTGTENTIPVYRLYHLKEGWHFWTTSANERTSLVNSGTWRDEGTSFNVDPSYSNTGDPVRRLYTQSNGGRHVFTSNANTISSLLRSGYVNEGVSFVSVSTNVQAPVPARGHQNVYRFQLRDSHFWTNSISERNQLIRSASAQYEGVGWQAKIGGANPAYRLYSPEGKHFWTTSANERDQLQRKGFRYEGVGWSTSTTGNPTYRTYNTRNGRHMWTMSSNERDSTLRGGWSDEGTAWSQP